jgi:serine/threonine protein kinase
MTERELFLSALEFADPAARRAHVQSACAGDAQLMARVEALIAVHETPSRFLNTPAVEQLARNSGEHSSTHEGDRDAAPIHSDQPDSFLREDRDDGIALSFLQPSTSPNSLGRLGCYEIYGVLGHGAFGIVLKAFDEKLERVVAIKVLAPELATTSPARKRFLREARSSARVRHENVVSIYAVEHDPIPYLVMEYISGQTLQARLDQHGPLDVFDVLRLGKQIADGLAAAHAQGLIHRDVKPGNILLETSNNDRVKITDFSLARAADDASMTQSGLIAGTPMYMAPEQATGQKLDQRADLFSLGSVLYQMISGRPPFRAPTTLAVLKRVVEESPRPISQIIPETPEWLCGIVSHLHAKDPDDRYTSAKEVSDLLAQCLVDGQAGRTPKVPTPSRQVRGTVRGKAINDQSRSMRRISNPLKAATAALLLVAIGLGITEATGVTQLKSTVVRLATGSGTLVVETDDPDVKIAIDGEAVTIRGAGVEAITLRSGQHQVVALKNGQPVKQELVSIARNGRTVVRMSLESSTRGAESVAASPVVAAASSDGWVSENVVKIWSEAPYNGFTDLIRFKDRWYCSFREGEGHAFGAGSIRILISDDAKSWQSAAVLRAENVDFRDGGLSVTPDNRLMLNSAAAVPATRDPLTDHYSFVSFSENGSDWTEPQRILNSWEWLWRVTWHNGFAYGVAYGWDPAAQPREYRATLYRSPDGIQFERVTQFDLPDASEAAVAFDGDVMLCLQRQDGQSNTTSLGRSEPPYVQWSWQNLGRHLAGPNLIQDPSGNWWAAGRIVREGARTAICQLDPNSGKLDVMRILPSGGDTGYSGMVCHQNNLWISYMSSHEGKTSVYLAHGPY